MHTAQDKVNKSPASKETGKPAQKAAHISEDSTRIPAWTSTWEKQPPGWLKLPEANVVPGIQAKLAVSQPEDPDEQEAERVAEQVMRKELNSEEGMQGAPSIASPMADSSSQPAVTSVQTIMESRFGQDFSNVRIHTGEQAARSADSLKAHAYTIGSDIVFGKGEYRPETNEGRKLLAHELTHVVQQGAGGHPSRGDAIQIRKTGGQKLQGSFFGDVWEKVKTVGEIAWKVDEAVWEGAKAVGSTVWEGTKMVGSAIGKGAKAVGNAVWEGTKEVGKWGWNVLKSAGAWVWDLITEAPIRIWRILKHVGSGIVGIVSWLWDGIKGAAGHIWEAFKGIFSWAKEGVVGLFSWIWEGLKGAGKWAWKLLNGDFSGFWEGIGDFFSWLGRGAVGLAKWGWEGLVGVVTWVWEGAKGVAKWLLDGFLSGAAWVGRFIAKLLDLIGFGEIMDLLWQIIKFNTRSLTQTEITEAKRVFGGTISYWQVRVDEYSLIAGLGALFTKSSGMGVTLFHTVNFNRKITPAPGSSDMGWLVHELTHVWQMEHVGMQYIGEAIHAQATKGYVYGVDDNYANNDNGTSLAKDRAAGKTFDSYNREQQGEITSHYYMRLTNGLSVTDWLPYIKDVQKP